MWAPNAAAICAAEKAAEEVLVAISVSLNNGDELHEALTREIGYGANVERLRTFLRRIQKQIERRA